MKKRRWLQMNQINNTQDLLNVAVALTEAVVKGRFMSAEHAKNIWLNILKVKGYDTEKKKPEIKETVSEDK